MSVHIFGGGTHFHVRPHLALCAPAYGSTARQLEELAKKKWEFVELHLTKMAGGEELDTNADISHFLRKLCDDPEVKVIFMSAALCDFEGYPFWEEGQTKIKHWPGKDLPRLKSRPSSPDDPRANGIGLQVAKKVISEIRKERKDIFLVGFKTTTGATPDQQFEEGLKLLKQSSCNLVLANDLHTWTNMIITPEQARYHVTTDRTKVLHELVEMAHARSRLRFTRSKVVEGSPVNFSDEKVPTALREVVEHCVAKGAYRPFLGKTVGHFAAKLDHHVFLTSIRGSDFNKAVNMVVVETSGPDGVIAHGAKPSVGGQSQRIIFARHPDTDSIVHFHCQLKPGSTVPVQSQREFECGSHECGENTANGLQKFGDIYAVMLDKHGPNIVFDSRKVKSEQVISFIEEHFDLSKQTSELSS